MANNEDCQLLWNAYVHALMKDPSLCLSTFIKGQPITRGCINEWLRKNHLSIYDTKAKVKRCLVEFRNGADAVSIPLPADIHEQEAVSDNVFVPLQIAEQPVAKTPSENLSGISITFPDGTQVSIRQGGPRAVMEFLKLYKSEEAICLG